MRFMDSLSFGLMGPTTLAGRKSWSRKKSPGIQVLEAGYDKGP
jgi:hypothetical protein